MDAGGNNGCEGDGGCEGEDVEAGEDGGCEGVDAGDDGIYGDGMDVIDAIAFGDEE